MTDYLSRGLTPTPTQGDVGKPALATRLAVQIIELAKREGLPADTHMREEWLADRLRVSRSPVRKAMIFLGDHGILRKEPNRGFFLAAGAASLSTKAFEAERDVEEDVYLAVADDQLNGHVTGGFTQADIARRYGINARQTTRVLARMEKEGLISRRPGLGWEFHPVLATVDALVQSYRFRMIIEPSALLEPSYKVDALAFAAHRRLLTSLVARNGEGSTRVDLNRIGSEFHEMIVGCSGNVYLLEALQRQNRMRRLMEFRQHPGPARSVKQAREHLALLDMLEDGDRIAAADFLREHLDKVRVMKSGA